MGKLSLLLSAFLLVACGGSIAPDDGSPATSPPATSASATPPAGPSVVAGPLAPSAGAVRCGSRGNVVVCAADEFCDYAMHDDGIASCGADGAPGECVLKSLCADKDLSPRCGCDGKTYGNACEAARAGVPARKLGACDAFECGSTTCNAQTSYCALSKYAESGTCIALPVACTATPTSGKLPTCDCFALWADPCVGCAPTCTRTMAGAVPAFTLTE